MPSLEQVQEALQQRAIPGPLVTQILADLKEATEAAKADKEPRAKGEYVLIASDPQGKLKGVELVGWAVVIPEGDSPVTVVDKVRAVGHAFNATRKGKKVPATNVAEVFESASPRLWKEHAVKRVNKTPVFLATTNNLLGEPPSA